MSDLKLLSADALAEKLGVKTSTVIDWRHKGTGPVYTKLGRRIYYRELDVEAWVLSNRRQIRRVEEVPANDSKPAVPQVAA